MGNFILGVQDRTPRMTPRSSATHAPESGLISTDANFDQILLCIEGLKDLNLLYM